MCKFRDGVSPAPPGISGSAGNLMDRASSFEVYLSRATISPPESLSAFTNVSVSGDLGATNTSGSEPVIVSDMKKYEF